MRTFSQPWMLNALRLAGLPIDVNEIVGRKFIFEFSCEGKGSQAIAGLIMGVSFTNDIPDQASSLDDANVPERHMTLTISTYEWYDRTIKGLWWRGGVEWELDTEWEEDLILLGQLTLL